MAVKPKPSNRSTTAWTVTHEIVDDLHAAHVRVFGFSPSRPKRQPETDAFQRLCEEPEVIESVTQWLLNNRVRGGDSVTLRSSYICTAARFERDALARVKRIKKTVDKVLLRSITPSEIVAAILLDYTSHLNALPESKE